MTIDRLRALEEYYAAVQWTQINKLDMKVAFAQEVVQYLPYYVKNSIKLERIC